MHECHMCGSDENWTKHTIYVSLMFEKEREQLTEGFQYEGLDWSYKHS